MAGYDITLQMGIQACVGVANMVVVHETLVNGLTGLEIVRDKEVEEFDVKVSVSGNTASEDGGLTFRCGDFDLHDEFKDNILNSMYINAFSTFEFALHRIAEEALYGMSSPFKLQDFKGSGVERAKLILKHFHGFSELFESDVGKRALRHRELRNIIAHSGGLIESPERSQKIAKLFTGDDALETEERVPGTTELKLDRKFVLRAAATFRDFFIEIYRLRLICEAENANP